MSAEHAGCQEAWAKQEQALHENQRRLREGIEALAETCRCTWHDNLYSELPMDCACPDDDPRPVIMHLLDALEATQKQAEAQGNKLADGLHKWRDEALAAEAENQRLREGIEALIPDLVDVVHGDFSHSAGLICDQCPGWPHTYCVPAEKLDALLSTSSVRGEGDCEWCGQRPATGYACTADGSGEKEVACCAECGAEFGWDYRVRGEGDG